MLVARQLARPDDNLLPYFAVPDDETRCLSLRSNRELSVAYFTSNQLRELNASDICQLIWIIVRENWNTTDRTTATKGICPTFFVSFLRFVKPTWQLSISFTKITRLINVRSLDKIFNLERREKFCRIRQWGWKKTIHAADTVHVWIARRATTSENASRHLAVPSRTRGTQGDETLSPPH